MHLSPWSERARWALDHHRVPYVKKTYTPMISEPALRLKLKRLGGRVTVPIFIDGELVLRDSFDIARHADLHGAGATLFPDSHQGDIASLSAAIEPALHAARALVTRRTAASSDAKRDALPGPAWAKPALSPLATLGVRYFQRKYDTDAHTASDDIGTIRAAAVRVRELLGGRDTIYESFSYADILAAGVVYTIEPPADNWLPMSAASRDVRTTPELFDEFADLRAWRDALYDAHR